MVWRWESFCINRVSYKGEVPFLLPNSVHLRLLIFHFFEFIANLGIHFFNKLVIQKVGPRARERVLLVGTLLKYSIYVGILLDFFQLKRLKMVKNLYFFSS